MNLNELINQVEESPESIDYILSKTPHALEVNKTVKKVAKFYLPFSTGFEIECEQRENFNLSTFKNIPNIVEVKVDSHEQRFRIPKGIKGLTCLYDISIALKENSNLNLGSGIHYHVNFNKYFELIDKEVIKTHSDWILKELDTWKYRGTYNYRSVTFNRTWVKFHKQYKTIEFRIGEMTFDYSLLFKRIAHCNAIVKKLINALEIEVIKKEAPYLLYKSPQEVIRNRINYI